jgi:GT2 family glycosyltransferase
MPPRTKQSSSHPLPDRVEETPKPSRVRPPKTPAKVVVDVTAVLVAHDGVAWLPEALRALDASTRIPARVLCVDTGSTDGSRELLAAAYGDVLDLPRDTGFGEAVAAALDGAPPSGWIWLLHDDLAVEPGTLEALLDHAATSPSAALLGPKVRDWNDPRVLVEVGITTDAAGHRETGLERREYDQGQRDDIRDVLAVGTAGALIKTDVWDAVGGLDPELPVFRDDLDLGWKVNAAGHRVVVVPTARVRHARAATTGHRVTDAAPGRATGTDRAHALFVLLAHVSGLRLLGLLPRLVLSTGFRALGLLLTRQVAAAGDEVRALLSNLGRPGRLRQARSTRAQLRTVSRSDLRPLFASRSVRIRARVGALTDWLSGGGAPGANPLGALGDPGPDGPDEGDSLNMASNGTFRRVLIRPGILLFAGLTAVSLIAERAVLFGTGPLTGGALLRTPPGASDLWHTYTAGWHAVTVGSSVPTPPATAALAALSTVLLGKPWLAVDVLLLASVPLAGVTAYVAATRLVRHLYLRLWAAATWALLPVATGSIASGRLDTAAVQIALPLLVLAAGRLLTDDPRIDGWWRAWALGLALGVTCAFAPLLWPLAAAVLLVGGLINLVLSGGRRRALAALVVAVVPGGLLFPWSLEALRDPILLVQSAATSQPVPVWHLLLLSPGGPAIPVVLVTAGLFLGALTGTIRLAFRRLAVACWAVIAVGYAAAIVLNRVRVDGGSAFPGLALQISGLAMIAAALVAANGARSRLARSSFGARQLLAAVFAVTAAALPVIAAGTWVVRGTDDPLTRDSRTLLPAFAQAELETHPGTRVLVVAPAGTGRVHYELADSAGTRLGDTQLQSSKAQLRALDAVVADLASPRGSDAAEALSTRAVRYVALRSGPGTGQLAASLDAQPGLVRRTSGGVVLWQVQAPAARLLVLGSALAKDALGSARAPTMPRLRAEPPIVLPAGAERATATVSSGAANRLLVLADAADSGWHATLGGKELTRRTAWGWAQGFVLPATGGRLELTHDHGPRRAALGAEVVLLLVVLVLSAPAGRHRRGLEDDIDLEEDDGVLHHERFVPVAAL